jgi:hypothetical protein
MRAKTKSMNAETLITLAPSICEQVKEWEKLDRRTMVQFVSDMIPALLPYEIATRKRIIERAIAIIPVIEKAVQISIARASSEIPTISPDCKCEMVEYVYLPDDSAHDDEPEHGALADDEIVE